MNADAISRSLELVAERAGDPAALVYARLFAAHPEMEALFVRDTNGQIKGHMLAQAIDAVLDFVGERRFGDGMMRNELVNHEQLGVPRDVFPLFFTTMRDVFRDSLGAQWTREIDGAWRALLSEIDTTLKA